MTKQIKSVDYILNDKGDTSHAIVIYIDGTRETVSSKDRILEVTNQIKFQQKQILMEAK